MRAQTHRTLSFMGLRTVYEIPVESKPGDNGRILKGVQTTGDWGGGEWIGQ